MSTSLTTRRRARWAVPAAVVVAVAAAVAVPTLASADDAALPSTTPAELLATMAQAEPTPLSGTAVYTARLGLPDLAAQLTGGADPLNLLGGSSTIKVWTDGAERSRVSLLGTASEYSAVTDGPELWTYSSAKNTVVHVSLDEAATGMLTLAQAQLAAQAEAATTGSDGAALPTPVDLAERVLERADEHSEVTLAEPTTVAGRSAYQLVVTPRSSQTLVDRVVIAVDAATAIPVSVQAWSTTDAANPALELTFTDLSLTPPSDAALAFSTPAGAEVVDHVITLDSLTSGLAEGALAEEHDGAANLPAHVRVIGDGWDTIVERSGVDVAGLLAGDPAAVEGAADFGWASGDNSDLMAEFHGEGGFGLDTTALYEEVTAPVAGGRVLTTALASVLVTDDGRVLVGAVPAEALLAAAGLE